MASRPRSRFSGIRARAVFRTVERESKKKSMNRVSTPPTHLKLDRLGSSHTPAQSPCPWLAPWNANQPPNKNPVSLLSSRTKHRTTPLSPSASQQSGSPCVRIYLMQPPLTLCVPRALTRLSVSPVPLVLCPCKHHQQTPFCSLSLLRSSRGL